MRQVPLVVLALTLASLTPSAHAQTFDCPPEDFVCPRLAFTNTSNQPVTSIVAGAELRVAALLNWSRPGTYTDVVVRVDGPPHFRLGIADSPGSFSRTCVNDTPTPQAIWDVSCTFTHQGPLQPDVGTSTSLPLTFVGQRWTTPFGYVGDFTITVSGHDPDGLAFERSFSRTMTLEVAPNLIQPANIAGSGGSQVLFDHDNDPATPRIKGRAFRTSTRIENAGTRTVTDLTLSWELPAFVHVTGLELRGTNGGFIGLWTLAPDNTATVGQAGGTLKARFDGVELVNANPVARFWPLALSQTLNSPSTSNNDGTPTATSTLAIDYVIACEDLPTSTAAGQPTTRRSGGGLHLDADGESVATSTPNYDDPIWRWSFNGSFIAPPCVESWDRGTGARKAKAAYDYPPDRYTASGMTSAFVLTLAAPDGAFELGPTTLRETLPPYTYLGHTNNVAMTNPEFTTWFCRFDDALAPTMRSDDFVLANHPNCAGGGIPCHGSNHYYAFDDDDLLDPERFNPLSLQWTSTFQFNPSTGQGCVLAASVCNPEHFNDAFGVRYGNADCSTKAFRADDVTHIYFTTWDHEAVSMADEAHLWRHPSDPNQRPETLSVSLTLRADALTPPPSGLHTFAPEKVANVENRMTVAGGLMQTTGCGLRDFAWFNRVCPTTGCSGCDDELAPPVPLERVAYLNIDNRARVRAGARPTTATVPFSLTEVEAAWVGCRLNATSTPLLFNPSLTLTLPAGFRPRPGGEAQRTGAPDTIPFLNVPMLWKDVVPGASDALLSGFLSPISNQHNPTWQQVVDAGLSWTITGPTVGPDGRTTVTLTPSPSTLNWQTLGNDSYVMTMPLIVRVEPIPDFPFVHGRNYQGSCEVTAVGPDGELVSSTATYDLNVPMPAQMTVIGQDLCRAGSHHPTFDMVMDNTGGRNLVNAESIMLLPQALAGTALTFASATLDPELELGIPPAFTLPLVEVSTASDLVARIQAGTTNEAGVFVAYNPGTHNGTPITAIRLRYPGTQFLPAYAQVRLRVALQLQALSLGLVGEDLTTRAWFAAPGSGLPYAESFDFDPFEVGQCPTTISALKTFDADGDGAPDASPTPLANWPITLTVKIPSAATSAPTTSQSALTDDAGLVTFVAYPGQTLELNETQPMDGGGASPDWLQTFPSLGAPHTLVVGFEAPASPLLFLNTCQCEDDYTCSATEDRCELVDPTAPVADQAVCVFGAPPDATAATSPTPVACREDDHVALVTDTEGEIVGAIRCRVIEGAMSCDTNPDGTLFIHTDRLECSR